MGLATRLLKGMKPEIQQVLRIKGKTDSDEFLTLVRTPTDRKKLAQEAGVTAADVLALANRADLARIQGIGAGLGDYLEAAGVDTVKELARRNAESLHSRIAEINESQPTPGRVPSVEVLRDFIEQATSLPPLLDY